SSTNSHTTPNQSPDMDFTTILGEVHAKERVVDTPSKKVLIKKNQKRPQVNEESSSLLLRTKSTQALSVEYSLWSGLLQETSYYHKTNTANLEETVKAANQTIDGLCKNE
ncbi:hypothetical protein J1N35_041392, partial [Gossypium stocksii]